MTSSQLIGTVADVRATHILLRWRDATFLAHRRELDFNDPRVGLQVSFRPGGQDAPALLPLALAVRKAS